MIKNYLRTWLLSIRRQKGFMLLNFTILVASMIVLTVLIGAARIKDLGGILKEDGGNLYTLEWCDNKGEWQTRLDVEQVKKINEINLPGVVSTMGVFNTFNLVKKGKQRNFRLVPINKPFSEILNVDFIAGNNFSDKHSGKDKRFVIINQKIAYFYFGETDVVGREIVLSYKGYTVIGVFRNLIENAKYDADVYTTGPASYESPSVNYAIIRFNSKKDCVEAEKTLNKHLKNISVEGPSYRLSPFQGKKQDLESVLFGGTLLFIFSFLLPALLLSNLTIHRMESRLNELGIRKAFGADKKTIYWQLIAENLAFTLLAGIIALFIGQFLISSLYYGAGVRGNWFSLVLPAELYFLIFLAFILFGIITGIMPARKVSRQSIVCSLNVR
jgi:ABC-type antimicrobial peptide transport system permease subunit